MIDILRYIPPNSKKSPAGWWSFCCPCCIYNGETRDKKNRGGIILDGNNWSFSCFNCGYKTKFTYGRSLTLKTKKLLTWLGVDEDTIRKINLDSLKHKSIYDSISSKKSIITITEFNTVPMPSEMRPITIEDEWAINYLRDERGLDYRDYNYKITPNSKGRYRRRIIIPYMYNKKVVGWTSRFLDSYDPKYLNEKQQSGYIFGLDKQKKDWEFIIVTEGIFDAISLDCISLLHNEISPKQEALLRRQGKQVIVIGDADKAGVKLMDSALEKGFAVSPVKWDNGIKDINEAVKTYGKIGVLARILYSSTTNKITAKMAMKEIYNDE